MIILMKLLQYELTYFYLLLNIISYDSMRVLLRQGSHNVNELKKMIFDIIWPFLFWYRMIAIVILY